LLVAAFGLASLGQITFTYRREYVWDGLAFWVTSIVLFSLAIRRLMVRRRGPGRGGRRHDGWLAMIGRHPVRAIGLGAALALSFASGRGALGRPEMEGFVDLLLVWIVAMASVMAAALPASWLRLGEWRRAVYRWLKENWATGAALCLLAAAAVVVRVYDLEHIPRNLGGDEGTQGVAARALVERPLGNPFSTGWYSVPTMSFLAYGVAMEVLGTTVSGLRALSALIGATTVVSTFLLARELWGERVAWLSGAVLAFGHYHVHFSRLGSNQIADALMVTLSLWLLVRGMRTREPWTFAAAGLTVGLGWYGYFGARLVGMVAAVYVGLQALRRHRFLARYRVLVALLVVGALVAAAPLLLHYASHPSEMLSRPNQVSIFASGWLAREREITGRSTLSLLAEQVWKAVSAFNYALDPTFWYRASIPLLDVVGGLFFVLGMVWAVARYRWPSNSLLLIWFWLALLLGWVMTENPPSSQRMVILAPALAVLVGLGIDWALRVGGALLGAGETARRAATTAVLMVMAGLNLGYYFLVYTPTRVYGNPTAEMTTVLARQLQEEGYTGRLYFHGPPAVYWEFGTLQFMVPEVGGVNVPPEGDPAGIEVTEDEARFVFHPTRLGELEDVRRGFPGGSERYVRSTADGELLYAEYVVNE